MSAVQEDRSVFFRNISKYSCQLDKKQQHIHVSSLSLDKLQKPPLKIVAEHCVDIVWTNWTFQKVENASFGIQYN